MRVNNNNNSIEQSNTTQCFCKLSNGKCCGSVKTFGIMSPRATTIDRFQQQSKQNSIRFIIIRFTMNNVNYTAQACHHIMSLSQNQNDFKTFNSSLEWFFHPFTRNLEFSSLKKQHWKYYVPVDGLKFIWFGYIIHSIRIVNLTIESIGSNCCCITRTVKRGNNFNIMHSFNSDLLVPATSFTGPLVSAPCTRIMRI